MLRTIKLTVIMIRIKMLSAVMLSVIMTRIKMLSVIMLSVIMPSVVKLDVAAPTRTILPQTKIHLTRVV